VTSQALTAALLAGAAVGLLVAPRRGLPRIRTREPDARPVLRRLRPLLASLAFVGGWAFVGGAAGLVAGGAGAAFSWHVLARTESPASRRRREDLERNLPIAVHLLGGCLEAGAAVSAALDDVTAALPGAVAEELQLVRHRLALGIDPVAVWRDLADHPELGPLGRALARAHQSGASARVAIAALADELTDQSRARRDALARSVEVRAAAPLGVCFLPAFVLLSVVPMVVGVFSAMRLFG
jgi:Flp pilus assembly protein TadB